jgi:hypothetical protein
MAGQQGRQCLLKIALERLLKLLGGFGPAIAGSRHGASPRGRIWVWLLQRLGRNHQKN